MRVPYKWLKQYVDVDLPPEEMARQLTMAGLAVEGIEELTPDFQGVVAGRITAINPHPNSDHLVVCQVDAGPAGRELQLVTGAPNVYEGQVVAVAREGARLPGGRQIKRATFRGVASAGMLCSAQELGLDVALISPEDREGIITLPPDAPPGEDVSQVLGLRDVVLVLELTPNRADCLSIINVAREVAALTGAPLHLPATAPPEEGPEIAGLAAVEIAAPDLCARYVARVVQGVRIGPSPAWLQACLRAAGMRPINNVVDITNFIMLEMGQPLHAFDYDRLEEHRVIARRAQPGEKMTTLDEVDRELDPEMLVIADATRPVAIAGVMGGRETEVTPATASILIESAHFDGASIRHTSRRLGLRSEASTRFERGVNLEGAPAAADRAALLMAQLAGGRVARGRIDRYVKPRRPFTIELRPERVNYLLGTDIAPAAMKELLERLHLEVQVKEPPAADVQAEDLSKAAAQVRVDACHEHKSPASHIPLPTSTLRVAVPAYRGDLTSEIDLVEEIARLYGYNQIPATLPGNISGREKQTPSQLWEEAGREAAAAAGLAEVVTYSFIGPRSLDQLRLPADHPWRRTVAIQNPLREEQSLLRTSLLPGLLEVAARNASRRVLPVAIYEMGRVFIPTAAPLPDEPLRLGGLVMGTTGRGWSWPAGAMDFYYLKGIVENILARLRVADVSWTAADTYPFLHPGRAAVIRAGQTVLGYLGELHPNVLAAADLPERACVFELDWEAAGDLARNNPSYEPLPRFPAVDRDLAVVVPAATPAATVAGVIRAAGGELLQAVTLFDVYQGSPIPAGYKSLAYSLRYQLPGRTLTDAEVNAAQERIQGALKERLGATLRQ
ncbi:phenylalanine--tRNA ligase subunit beta [Moorella sp. Hama-1]|uniref:phenylalanine--tRNA ligase subunit beta n=1 Tax=Moorella sp. Hama-1 TaxID=2138101 RepID=UPI000D64D9B1|nr:phenylalanine--tRNA ligase subunit beta [Moorella sp. Hama-1]BCV22007.1 phenylalanine--tRNA ligase beta subunit [Moorella sp. Hama-1]